MATIVLLVISNIFMTLAWYGHLKFKETPLWIAIAVSWLIALLEYCFQVPANRIGHGRFTTTQLKILQEAITLIVFCAFVVIYMKEHLHWNYFAAFLCIFAAVYFVFGFPAAKPDNAGETSTLPGASLLLNTSHVADGNAGRSSPSSDDQPADTGRSPSP